MTDHTPPLGPLPEPTWTPDEQINETGYISEDAYTEDQMRAYALQERAAAQQWQPIATAPRDGRRVLVWIEDKSYTGHAFAKLWFYSTDRRLGGGAEGFNGDWNITHWMPLPPPPQRAEPGKDAT